jgi:hypothetical protein
VTSGWFSCYPPLLVAVFGQMLLIFCGLASLGMVLGALLTWRLPMPLLAYQSHRRRACWLAGLALVSATVLLGWLAGWAPGGLLDLVLARGQRYETDFGAREARAIVGFVLGSCALLLGIAFVQSRHGQKEHGV